MMVLPEYQQVDNLIARGQFADALSAIQSIVYSVHRDPLATAEVYSSPFLDEACQRIGSATLSMSAGTPVDTGDIQIYVASALHDTGGHSRVLYDYVKLQPNRRHLVVLTNFFDEPLEKIRSIKIIQALIDLGVTVKLVVGRNPLEKLVSLQRELRARPSANVFLFNHHGDSVAVAAVQPGLNANFFYCHHADHNLALGCHLSGVTHVDLHGYGYYTCRDILGVTGQQYWPLSIPDHGPRVRDPHRTGPLVTGACGSPNKFEGPYVLDYFEIVSRLLVQTGGRHFHIGPLDQNALIRMQRWFQSTGCPVDRFVHIPHVDDLWLFLKSSPIDAFFSSFPQGGGRASIEAMGCGIPLIYHLHAVAPSLGGGALGPSTAPVWRNWAELSVLISSLTPEYLGRLSQDVRRHYEANYAPSVLQQILADMRSDLIPENRNRWVPDSYLRHRIRMSMLQSATGSK